MRVWRKLLGILGVLIASAAVVAAMWFGMAYFADHYIPVNARFYRRDVQAVDVSGRKVTDHRAFAKLTELKQLDLRGTGLSTEDYEWLRSALPGCEIVWDLTFQGRIYPLDTRAVRIDTLTDEDILLLDYLPQLSHVDALGCTDYEQLAALKKRRPECSVLYQVAIGGGDFLTETEELVLVDVTFADLQQRLPLLTGAKTIRLTGFLPTPEELAQLQSQFPAVDFRWEVAVGEEHLDMDTESLTLSGSSLDGAQTEQLLRYFPRLRQVELRGCALLDEEIRALTQQFPQCFFLWDMVVGEISVPTDAEMMDLSGKPVPSPEWIEEFLPYFPNLKKVVMCDCGLSNEQMDDLNRRYPDIRFVWSVSVGKIRLRTDAIYYMPTKWGDEVTDADLENLRYCEDMVCVDLGHMEITKCQWAAYMPHLQYLVLADTGLDDIAPLAEHKELVFLELFLTQVRDTTPLVSCTALEDLNLCYTYADPEPVSRMTWLKRIWWSGNWRASDILPRAIPDARMEFHTGSSTGAGWRQGKRYYEMRDILGMRYMTG